MSDPLLSRSSLSIHGSLSARPHDERRTDERWEERGELGWGGMGRVVLMWDRWLEREVAVKQPLAALDVELFEREALITARLEHPGIVPVYDLGAGPDGRPWFAMRVVRGRSLANLLESRADAQARLELLRPLLSACEAVAYAHDRGFVHRDLKPSNLMLGPFGESLVIDWGLALGPGFPEARGSQVGTPRYMSPEQARREAVGPATDVFALGLILFEVVSGRRAFDEGDAASVVASVSAGRVPDLRDVAPHTSPELAAIVARALAPAIEDRYPDAKALAADLSSYLDGRRVAAHNYTTLALLLRVLRAWRAPLTVAALALLTLAVVIGLAVMNIADERDRARHQLGLAFALAAESAARSGARADAEILATAALDHASLASARGVLAALAGPRPRREVVAQVPCTALDALDGRVLCRHGDELELYEGGALRWRVPHIPDRGAAFLGGDRVIVASPAYILSALTGEDRASQLTPNCGGRMRRSAGGRYAVDVTAQCVAVLDELGSRRIPNTVCGDLGFDAFALAPDDNQWVAACNDGTLVRGRLDGDEEVRPIPMGAHDGVVTALSFGREGGALLVGTSTGQVLEVDELGRTLAFDDRAGLVRSLEVDRARDLLLVVRDVGPAEALTLSDHASLGRLPDRRGAFGALDSDGSVVLVGASYERWRFDGVRPHRLALEGGVSSLSRSPDGRRLAVGHGPSLTLIDPHSRRVLATTRWQRGLVKDVAFGPSGRVLAAHGMSEITVRTFSSATLEPVASVPLVATVRRVVLLDEDTLMTSSWRRGVHVFHGEHPTQVWPESLRDLVASDDGRSVAALDEHDGVWVGVDLSRGGGLSRCGDAGEAQAVAIDPIDGGLWLAGRAGVVPACGGRVEPYEARGADLISLAVSRHWFAAGTDEGMVYVWQRGQRQPFATYHAHGGRASSVVIDPAEAWLASGGWDGVVTFMSLSLGERPPLQALEAAWGIDLEAAFGASPEELGPP